MLNRTVNYRENDMDREIMLNRVCEDMMLDQDNRENRTVV